MAQVDQIQIGSTTYDILQSDNASFTGVSNDTTDSGATSWTSVAKLANTETNASIFTKMSSMFKNIRFLYSKIGNLDIGDIGTSIGDAIKNLAENKADKNHTHNASTLKASNGTSLIVTSLGNSSDNEHVPSALLVKNMNETLTALNNASSGYVTSLRASGKTIYYRHGSTDMGSITTQDTTYGVATSAKEGLLRKLEPSSTTKFLCADGTWKVNESGTTYAVTTTAKAGLAPRLDGSTAKYLRADGNWATPPDTKYTLPAATSNALGGIKASLSGTTLTLNNV